MRPIDADALFCDGIPFGDPDDPAGALRALIDKINNAPTLEIAAELEQVKRERDAAIRDCARFPCYTCNERENGDYCPQCRTTGTFRSLHEWRGLCRENGGSEYA